MSFLARKRICHFCGIEYAPASRKHSSANLYGGRVGILKAPGRHFGLLVFRILGYWIFVQQGTNAFFHVFVPSSIWKVFAYCFPYGLLHVVRPANQRIKGLLVTSGKSLRKSQSLNRDVLLIGRLYIYHVSVGKATGHAVKPFRDSGGNLAFGPVQDGSHRSRNGRFLKRFESYSSQRRQLGKQKARVRERHQRKFEWRLSYAQRRKHAINPHYAPQDEANRHQYGTCTRKRNWRHQRRGRCLDCSGYVLRYVFQNLDTKPYDCRVYNDYHNGH